MEIDIWCDFECPLCEKSIRTLLGLIETLDKKDSTSVRLHPASDPDITPAAKTDAWRMVKYVEALYGYEASARLWLVLSDAFAKGEAPDSGELVRLAESIGLETDDARDLVLSDQYLGDVLADERKAVQTGIDTLPLFMFDDGRTLCGDIDADAFKAML